MNTVILAINSKYIHSSLAPWYLVAGVTRYARHEHNVTVVESTINQPISSIVQQILPHAPQVIGISTYIWNAAMLPNLITELRTHLPDVIIALGGPEAEHNPEYWLTQGADHVLCGEGEQTFAHFLDAISANRTQSPLFQRGWHAQRDGYFGNDINSTPTEPLDPFTPTYFDSLNGRIAYIESSRGCPFSCSYCLSGDSKVTFFPLDMVKAQIDKLINSETTTIKFIDRTFNCNKAHANELFQYIINLDTSCCFHFEVAADLFDSDTLSLLATAPPGRIQMEIGLQSYYQPTLSAVGRKTDLDLIEHNIRTLLSHGNIHTHVGLIAGLPHETLDIFRTTFNRAYQLKSHNLQLGFLKLLYGSKLRQQASEFGIHFTPEPPYEITQNRWLSAADLYALKNVEDALQSTYNSGRFLSTLEYLLAVTNISPFDFFRSLGEVLHAHAIPLNVYADELLAFCLKLPNIDSSLLKDCLICDMLQTTKGTCYASFMKERKRFQTSALLKAEKIIGHPISRDETAILSCGKQVFVDRDVQKLVTKLYELCLLKN